jgi:thioredoxin reductase
MLTPTGSTEVPKVLVVEDEMVLRMRAASGVYVAGDVSRDVLLVAVAIAEGAEAAVAINKAFLRRDGFCDQ